MIYGKSELLDDLIAYKLQPAPSKPAGKWEAGTQSFESLAGVAAYLGEQGILVYHGHYCAVAVMERLGVLDRGGLVRIGFVHYNTFEEVDRVIAALTDLATKI